MLLDLGTRTTGFLGVTLTLYFVVLAFFGVFFVLPIAVAVRGAFLDQTGALTLDYLVEVFRNPIYLEGFTNALKLAVGSTVLAFSIAAPLAWISERFEFPAKRLLSAFLLLPMMLPPFVGAIGFRQIFGQEGAVNAVLRAVGCLGPNQVIDWLGSGREWGIILLNALHLYPILYLNLVAALANVDPALLEAAENLGCSGLRRAWRVTVPLVMPGIFAGGTIVFIWAFTELGVPLMFDYYRVTPVQIFNGLSDIDSNPFTYALVAVTLIGSALIYLAIRLLAGKPPPAMPGRGGHAGQIVVLGGLRGYLCSFFCSADLCSGSFTPTGCGPGLIFQGLVSIHPSSIIYFAALRFRPRESVNCPIDPEQPCLRIVVDPG